jgi:poly(3-hydroxybutyrate) depolymerase
MMTQALMAVYPDLFKAGSTRAGVPAGCWADGYDSGQQWSNTCASGNVTKTAQAWGDAVRAMYSGYSGHRPRVQIIQGTADSTINFNNTAESIKEWTNVLELASSPISTDTAKTAIATCERQFWKNSCGFVVLEAWVGKDGSHSMGYEEEAILKFFGLDKVSAADPEDTSWWRKHGGRRCKRGWWFWQNK